MRPWNMWMSLWVWDGIRTMHTMSARFLQRQRQQHNLHKVDTAPVRRRVLSNQREQIPRRCVHSISAHPWKYVIINNNNNNYNFFLDVWCRVRKFTWRVLLLLTGKWRIHILKNILYKIFKKICVGSATLSVLPRFIPRTHLSKNFRKTPLSKNGLLFH